MLCLMYFNNPPPTKYQNITLKQSLLKQHNEPHTYSQHTVYIQFDTWTLYFLHKCCILGQEFDQILAVLLGQTDIFNCFVVFQTLYLLIPQFLWKHVKMLYGNLVGNHWSEQWKVQFQSNDLFSYEWMQPYYRRNCEITGNRENTEVMKNYRWCNGIKRKWRENYIHVKGNNNCGLHLSQYNLRTYKTL